METRTKTTEVFNLTVKRPGDEYEVLHTSRTDAVNRMNEILRYADKGEEITVKVMKVELTTHY